MVTGNTPMARRSWSRNSSKEWYVEYVLLIWINVGIYWQFQRNGFFVEAGALDGERGSNSLSLEKDLGWSGLLAEGDPSNVKIIKYEEEKYIWIYVD